MTKEDECSGKTSFQHTKKAHLNNDMLVINTTTPLSSPYAYSVGDYTNITNFAAEMFAEFYFRLSNSLGQDLFNSTPFTINSNGAKAPSWDVPVGSPTSPFGGKNPIFTPKKPGPGKGL